MNVVIVQQLDDLQTMNNMHIIRFQIEMDEYQR